MKKTLKMRPYYPASMNELSDADMDLLCDSCPTSREEFSVMNVPSITVRTAVV